MSDSPESDITEVLKALNHEIRREIIRMLHNARPMAYSVFLNKLNLPASGNVAYHLSLLNKAHLLEKDKDGKYFLTQLGQRSALLLDLVTETKSSPFSDLYMGFSRLTPFETLLGSWWVFFLLSGAIILPSAFLISLIFFSLAGVSLILIVYRSKVIWSLLLLNNFLWIYFAPENRLLLFSIVLTNFIGIFLMFPEVSSDLSFPQNPVIGIFLIIISILLSLIYLYFSYGGSFSRTYQKKRDDNLEEY